VRHRLFIGTLARVPLGGSAPREVLDSVREADWSPGYVQALAGGAARPVTPPGTSAGFGSPDGQEVAAFNASLGHRRYPVAGGSDRAIGDVANVDRVDLATGRRAPLVTLGNRTPGGPWRLIFFAMADDPHVYLSEIFTVDGVR